MEQKSTIKSAKTPDLPTAAQQLFVGTIISLSWQLLIVVVGPFLGGHFLDEKYHTTPLWTLIGLGVALLLAGLVTYRGYVTVSNASKGPRS